MRKALLIMAILVCFTASPWLSIWQTGPIPEFVAFGIAAANSVPDAAKATSLHRQGWEQVLTKAMSDNAYRYAIYASRSLAVVHPELYLQGDGLFLQHVSSMPGYAAAYQEQDPHSSKYTEGFSGPSFDWSLVDLTKFSVVPERDVYPSDVPFFDFLDTRLGTVAVCLKATDRKVTALEMAALRYWSLPGGSATRKESFLIYSSTHEAFLATDGKLLSASHGAAVSEIVGKPVLIFNEWSVWYPLLGRDDRGEDGALERLVQQLRGDASCVPELNVFESSVMPKVRTVTRMDSPTAERVATLYSVRGIPEDSGVFRTLVRDILPNYPTQTWLGLVENRMRNANLLSPVTALLASMIDPQGLPGSVERMTAVWHGEYETEHGHVWECNFISFSVDDVPRVKSVHCAIHAACIAAVLDLAQVANYQIEAWRSERVKKNDFAGHTYVTIPQIGYVISNGEVSDRGQVLCGTTGRLGGLCDTFWFIASGDLWAFPYVGWCVGNWAPADLANTLGRLQSLFNERIHGLVCDWQASVGKTYFRRQFLSSEQYIPQLAQQQNWGPFVYP